MVLSPVTPLASSCTSFLFFFRFFIRYLLHLHFKGYPQNPLYPPPASPLPTHSHFLALVSPVQGHIKFARPRGLSSQWWPTRPILLVSFSISWNLVPSYKISGRNKISCLMWKARIHFFSSTEHNENKNLVSFFSLMQGYPVSMLSTQYFNSSLEQ